MTEAVGTRNADLAARSHRRRASEFPLVREAGCFGRICSVLSDRKRCLAAHRTQLIGNTSATTHVSTVLSTEGHMSHHNASIFDRDLSCLRSMIIAESLLPCDAKLTHIISRNSNPIPRAPSPQSWPSSTPDYEIKPFHEHGHVTTRPRPA